MTAVAAKPIADMKSEKEKLKASISTTLQPKDKSKEDKKEFEPSGDSRIEKDGEKRKQQLERLKDHYRDLFKIRKKLAMLINIEPEEDNPELKTKHQARERSILIIDTDIPRTFPKLGGIFQEEGIYHERLKRILEAFTMYRPDIGYVQGMSYVAATLLLYMDNEY